MKIVDTRGQLCPAPIIAAKKALKEAVEEESFLLITDSNTSYNNLLRFLRDNKAEVKSEKYEDRWELIVRGKGANAQSRPEEYCSPDISHFEKGDFIVVISSDTMGEGDSELGHLLMGNFIKALKDLDTLPGKVIFYNRGVTLAVKGSPVAEHLNQLEKMGVEIILCTTCVNHFGIADQIFTGISSDMFTIVQEMANAAKILRP